MRLSRLSALVHRMVLCAALGLCTTVLVAWLLAALLPHRNLWRRLNVVQTIERDGKLRYTAVLEYRRAGMVRRMWMPGLGGPGWPTAKASYESVSTMQMRPPLAQDRSWGNITAALAPGAAPTAGMEDARGWPFPSLWCELDSSAIDAHTAIHPVIAGFAISGPSALSGQFRALPLRPIGSGIVLDSAVFSAAWAVAIPAAAFAQRRVCRWRGLCPHCGYSRDGARQGPCPECGSCDASAASNSE